jgi:hypothetical protein
MGRRNGVDPHVRMAQLHGDAKYNHLFRCLYPAKLCAGAAWGSETLGSEGV